jgi:hypothetical protein
LAIEMMFRIPHIQRRSYIIPVLARTSWQSEEVQEEGELSSLGKLVTKSNKNQQNQQNGTYFNLFYCTAVILLIFDEFC